MVYYHLLAHILQPLGSFQIVFSKACSRADINLSIYRLGSLTNFGGAKYLRCPTHPVSMQDEKGHSVDALLVLWHLAYKMESQRPKPPTVTRMAIFSHIPPININICVYIGQILS